MPEFTYADEREAHEVRREFARQGHAVSLIAFDTFRGVYAFDVFYGPRFKRAGEVEPGDVRVRRFPSGRVVETEVAYVGSKNPDPNATSITLYLGTPGQQLTLESWSKSALVEIKEQ